MEKVRALARKVSNWGRWGRDDELGTLNLVTPDREARERLREACDVFSLGLASNPAGRRPLDGRTNPIHLMSAIERGSATPKGSLQRRLHHHAAAVRQQWDALAHVHYGGQLYNGHPISTLRPRGRAETRSTRSGEASSLGGFSSTWPPERCRSTPGSSSPRDLDAAEARAGTGYRRRRAAAPDRTSRRFKKTVTAGIHDPRTRSRR